MGKASRRKRRHATDQHTPAQRIPEQLTPGRRLPGKVFGPPAAGRVLVGEWSAARAAHRVLRLRAALLERQPALLDVLFNGYAQHVESIQQRAAAEPDPQRAELLRATLALHNGLPPEEIEQRIEHLGQQMRRGAQAGYPYLLDRLHELLPNGRPYPAHTEALVISPQMHDVVMAAAMTVTPDDLGTVDPDLDPPTPVGLLLLPSPRRGRAGVYAPTSLIGWRPLSGKIVPDGAVRAGMFVEGWSLRPELDTSPMWAVAVRAARIAGTPAPPGLPLSTGWLLNASLLTERERAVLDAREQVNDDIAHQHITQHRTEHHRGGGGVVVGEYDPDNGVEPDFTCAAYVFAFWRLCQQHTTTDRGLGAEGSTAASGGGRPHRQRALDEARVIDLRRRGSTAGAGAGHCGLQHRFPVRMHKVRQYYPSLHAHKVIWRGPYIKGPDGAPTAHRRQSPRHPVTAIVTTRPSPLPVARRPRLRPASNTVYGHTVPHFPETGTGPQGRSRLSNSWPAHGSSVPVISAGRGRGDGWGAVAPSGGARSLRMGRASPPR